MTRPVYLFLHVASALLLLLLCSSTSCLGSMYLECLGNYTCGDFEIGYPFGKINSGCGDPDFQLGCDPSGFPIIGNDFLISKPYLLRDDSNHTMTTVNGSIWIWGDKLCNLPGNYSQAWWSGSEFFHMDGYTNLTFWKSCNQIPRDNYGSEPLSFWFCGDVWYYSLTSELEGTRFCTTHVQVPIPESYLSHKSINNETLQEQIFEVTWQVDPDRHQHCDACLKSNGSCGYNVLQPTMFLCHCPDGTSHRDECPRNGPNRLAIIIGCSVAVAVTSIALVLFLRCYAKRRKTRSRGLANDFGKYKRKDMEAVVVHRAKIGNLPIFSYEELRQATNCFHEENELGDGGFEAVYMGELRDGQIVAVKRLSQDNSRRVGQFINEVAIFSTLNHPRVVRLYGCTSADSPELLLVYAFVPNGTLADHLHGDRRNPRGLPWDTRLNIAIQTAEALAFLHSIDPPIFHSDVKTSNILLDENFNVKVADFGLCRHVPVNASHVSTTPQGTPGYVDPEYHQYYQLTEKSDVYSFGVVLVEIISAKLAVDVNRNTREINLANMAISKIQEGALHELVDPQLEMETNHEVKVTVSAVAELAIRCLASESDDRPPMKEVVAQLEVIRGLWGVCPSPHEQSVSFPTHKLWRSFPTSVQGKWPIMTSARNASA